MAFNFGAMLGGFAKRETEKADRARQDAMDLAKSTLNYRAERAMANKKARETRISEDVRLGRNLIDNYGFSKAQVGALIGQGELENVYSALQEYAVGAKKGQAMPMASTLVKMAEDKPIDMSLEDYVTSLYMTPAAAPGAMKEYGYSGQSRGVFDIDTGKDARQFSQDYARAMGMSLEDMTREAFAGDPRVQSAPDARLDLTSLRERTETEDNILPVMKAAQRMIGERAVSKLRLGASFDLADNFIPSQEDYEKDNYIVDILAGVRKKVSELMAGGMDRNQAVMEVSEKYQTEDAMYELAQLGGYQGEKMKFAVAGGDPDPSDDDYEGGFTLKPELVTSLESASSITDVSEWIKTLPPEQRRPALDILYSSGSDVPVSDIKDEIMDYFDKKAAGDTKPEVIAPEPANPTGEMVERYGIGQSGVDIGTRGQQALVETLTKAGVDPTNKAEIRSFVMGNADSFMTEGSPFSVDDVVNGIYEQLNQ